MPVRKLVNPKRKKRLSLRGRRRDARGRLLPKKNRRRNNPKRRATRRAYRLKPRVKVNRTRRRLKVKRSRSKSNPHLVLMGLNPVRGGSHMRKLKKKRKNPSRRHRYTLKARPRHNRRRSYRLRRTMNPFGMRWGEFAETSAFAIVGGVASRSLPQYLLPNQNQGLVGYGLNAVTTALLAWLAGKVRPAAGKGVAIGGAVMLGGRVISDYFGKTLVTFGLVDNSGKAQGTAAVSAPAQSTTQLGAGDLAFDLRGYKASYFPLPMTSAKDLTYAKPWQGDINSLQAMISAGKKGASAGASHGPAGNATSTAAKTSGRYGSLM